MYIDKNKGIFLIEILVVIFVTGIIFQVIYIFFNSLNKERSIYLKNLYFNIKISPLSKKIQNSMYEGIDYKIYDISRLDIVIDYSKESLIEGNTLIIENFSIENSELRTVEVYYYNFLSLTTVLGTVDERNIIRLEISGKETILNQIEGVFKMTDYGFSMEGRIKNEEYKKEFKR